MTEPKKRSRFAAIFDDPPQNGTDKKPRLDQPAAASIPAAVPIPAPATAAGKTTEELLEEKKRKIAELLAKTKLPTAPAGPAAIAAANLSAGQSMAQQQFAHNNNVLTSQAVMSAIEKARSAAQQKAAPVLLGTNPSAAAPNQTKRVTSMVLKFDELGRPIDEEGNVIGLPNKEALSSLKVNQRLNKGKLKIEKPVLETDPTRNPYFDPNMKLSSKHKERHAFNFHEQGYFEKMAEQQRAKARLEKLQKELEEKAKRAGIDALVDITPRVIEPPKVPEIEWWDSFFVHDLSYDGIEQEGGIKEDLISHLVQHPVPLKPPGYKDSEQNPELRLTPQERKKLRRQKRLEAQKETQEKIALGLIPAPPPRITMSNFMRVLANDAIQDPTKMEKFAREQVEKRKNKHEAENEARKLTPEQRKEKLKQKLEKDQAEHGTHVAVFRITDLSNHKFKTDKNAQQLHLTGCGILYKNMNLVVVEGGPRAIRKYKKLMLHRIKWNEENNDDDDEDEDHDDDDDDSKPVENKSSSGENQCLLVWEGIVKKPAFKSFRFKQCATELLIISFLEKFGVPQYWDFAKNFKMD